MADVFISYKSERRPAARYLWKILEKYGYSAWFDYNLSPGEDFAARLERELASAKVCVVLWCEMAVTSRWVAKEAAEAQALGTYLPCWIQKAELPPNFAAADTINLIDWDGGPRSHALDRLLIDIGRRVGRPPAPNFEGLVDLDEDWRTLGSPSLARFALGETARVELLHEGRAPAPAPVPESEPEPPPTATQDVVEAPVAVEQTSSTFAKVLQSYVAKPAPVRGSVIVCPGRTEFIEKYFEVTRELQDRGFVVFCIDWRGQGLSGRETMNALKSHMNSFDDSVNDLDLALRLLRDRLPRPHVMLSQGMGGLIALRAMQTRRVDVDAAAFVSPMWGMANFGESTRGYARMMTSLGAGERFGPGSEQKWKRENFKDNLATHDKERHARTMGLISEEPRLALAGPTMGWLASAADAIEGLNLTEMLHRTRVPCLVVSGARDETIDHAALARVAGALPDCRAVQLTGAKNEILMEKDDIRAQFWAAFDDLAERVSPWAEQVG